MPEVHGPRGVARPRPDDVVCLASWGRLLDPEGLARRAGAPPDESPPELLARRYRQVGLRLADEVRGTVCALIWDGTRGRLVALRDRLGLGGGPCWAVEGDRLVVAVHASRLARESTRPVRPDPTSSILHLHGRGPLPGCSFYAGVAEVPPGAWLVAGRREVEVRRYWSVDPEAEPETRDDEAWADELRETLRAVGRDLSPTRPATVSLSGGLDSPSVAAALRQSVPAARLSALHRTTPRLEAGGESDRARATARHLGIPLKVVDGTDWWTLRDAEGPLTGAESPYRPPYAEAWQATFRLAAEGGAASLFTGSGGDHLFFGSRAYRYADLLVSGRWGELAREWWRHPAPRPSARQVAGAALHAGLPPRLVATRHRVPWLPRRRREEGAQAFAALQPGRRAPSRRELALALRDNSVPVVLAALAALARPHGVELHHPFFDHRLVELAARLPSEQAARGGVRKRVLRAAVRPWLPTAVVEPHEKILPVEILHRGLRERETDRVWRLLDGMRAAEAGLVDEARLRRGYRDYLAGRGDFRFWYAVTLESWLRHWF